MKKTAIIVALLGCTLAWSGPCRADKSEYMGLLPEQIEKQIRTESAAYRDVMNKIRVMENSGADKNSAAYKSTHDELIRQAEERKVSLDSLREALQIQHREYGE